MLLVRVSPKLRNNVNNAHLKDPALASCFNEVWYRLPRLVLEKAWFGKVRGA